MRFICLFFLVIASFNAFSEELENSYGQKITEGLEDLHQVSTAEKGLDKLLQQNGCHEKTQTSSTESSSEWAVFLKIGLLDTGTNSLSSYFQDKDIKNIQCGETAELDPVLKLWDERAKISNMFYNCPSDEESKGAGLFPAIIFEAKIDNKNCYMSFSPEIVSEIFRTKEQIQFSNSSLSKYARNISCVVDDKVEFVVFSNDDKQNFKIISDQRFEIKDNKFFNPYTTFNLAGVGAGAYLNFKGPHLGAAFSATLIGNVLSVYGGSDISLNNIMSTMFLSEETKESVQKYLKDKNIDGYSQVYFSLAEISGRNLLLENLNYSYPELTRQFSSLGLKNVVGTSMGENGDLTLQLNSSLAPGGDFALRVNGHMKVNDDIDLYANYGLNSSFKATYDIGDEKGLTLGAQITSLTGPGLCAGYFSQKKNGLKDKQGVCIGQGGGEYYSQDDCPELYGTSCNMSVTNLIPSLAFIDIRNISSLRPGEYYRLEDGNLVGLRKMQDDNGDDYYHFQLYQYPPEVSDLRESILETEEEIKKNTPISYIDLDLSSVEKAKEYKEWLSKDLLPFLEQKKGKIKSVRIQRSWNNNVKNELTSDGVLIVKRFNNPLDDSNVEEVDYSMKRKKPSEDEVDSELAEMMQQLKKNGVIIDLDLNVLNSKEQIGLKQYLKFLTANYGVEGLKGRRLIFTEDTTQFLGLGEAPFDFEGVDIKISIPLLENITNLDFSQTVPTDFSPKKPSDCKGLNGDQKTSCMEDAFLSVIYSNNFQIGGRKVKFVDREEMKKLIPSRGSGVGSKGHKNIPFSKVVGDDVYIISNSKRIENYLEPGIFHSPVNSIKGLMIPSELEDTVDLLRKTADKTTFSYENNGKNHEVKLAGDDAVLYNFKNRGNDQYYFTDVYEDEVNMTYQDRKLSNCFQVKDGVATAYFMNEDNVNCGDYNDDNSEVAGSVSITAPDSSNPALNSIFQKYLPVLFQVKELKK